jgi:hypothetical protein
LSFHTASAVDIVEVMIARRIAALFVMLLMAHLDLARAYAACSRPETHPAVDHQQAAHSHSGMTSAPTEPTDAPEGPPSPAECCRAMASCGLSLALTHAAPGDAAWMTRGMISFGVVHTPSSQPTAPEPPPPRA